MNNWRGAIRNEWDLIWLRGGAKVLLALSILLPIGLGLLMNAINASFGLLVLDSNGILLTTLKILISVYLPLLIFKLVSDGFTYQPQVLKAFFLRPVKRYKLYSAKIIAIAGIISLHLGTAYISALLSGWFFQEWNGWSGVLHGIVSYSMSILPMLLWIALGGAVAQCFKNQTMAMVILILVYLFSQIAPFLFANVSAFSPAYYNDWFTLAGAGTIGPILNGLFYQVSSIALYFLLGFIMFERRNI